MTASNAAGSAAQTSAAATITLPAPAITLSPPGVTVPLPGVTLPLPKVSKASLTNKRFRVGRATTAIAASPPVGTRFRFTLSATSRLQIVITRSLPGLRSGRRCVKPTARLRRAHGRRCTRSVKAGTLIRASEPAGADTLAFSGRIGRQALKPGAYKAVLTASDTAGTSAAVTLSFTVVR